VLLLGGSARTGRTYSQASYRGAFRLLTEQHIPFAVSDNMDWLGKREFDLVVATDWAPPELQRYVEAGGRVLILSARPPEFAVAKVLKTLPRLEGYFRVRDHGLFPALKQTSLVMLNGEYTEVEPGGTTSALTLVPPSMIGPPEKIHIDQVDTTKPGLVIASIGKGKAAWAPWDVAGLYYKHGLPTHGGLIADLVDHLLPNGRQLETNAHPLVEMSLMRQGSRTLLHLMNVSGHSSTSYFAPLPMSDVRVKIGGTAKSARAIRAGAPLRVVASGGKTEILLPRLTDYELIVLE
jgi:hypothetical protein